MKKSFKMKNVLTSKMVTMAFGAHKSQTLCFVTTFFFRFTKIISCTLKNENVNFLFCCEPCCQCKEKAKVNRTKILQKFLNFTILFTDLDWQRKVKWFRALKFENQARGTRVIDILNFFKKISKSKVRIST